VRFNAAVSTSPGNGDALDALLEQLVVEYQYRSEELTLSVLQHGRGGDPPAPRTSGAPTGTVAGSRPGGWAFYLGTPHLGARWSASATVLTWVLRGVGDDRRSVRRSSPISQPAQQQVKRPPLCQPPQRDWEGSGADARCCLKPPPAPVPRRCHIPSAT
jgi:hypothetical protein